jgi:hypothetical protein
MGPGLSECTGMNHRVTGESTPPWAAEACLGDGAVCLCSSWGWGTWPVVLYPGQRLTGSSGRIRSRCREKSLDGLCLSCLFLCH